MIGRMINVLGGIAACAGALCIALPSAATDSDLYVEYSAGFTHVPNQRIIGDDSSGSNLSGKVESDEGFNIGMAFGKRFYEHFRGEIQLTYRENEVSNMSLRNESDNASGHIGLLAIMLNGYIDWDLGIGVIPYFGTGMGWGSVEIEAKNRAPNQSKIDGRDSVFAWSLMAGGSYPINDVLDISLGYRYIATTKPKVNSTLTNPQPNDPPDDKIARRLKAEFDAHEVVVGLRFNF
jgi:opacity protein-like surface antigen